MRLSTAELDAIEQRAKACGRMPESLVREYMKADIPRLVADLREARAALKDIWDKTQYYKTELDGVIHKQANVALAYEDGNGKGV